MNISLVIFIYCAGVIFVVGMLGSLHCLLVFRSETTNEHVFFFIFLSLSFFLLIFIFRSKDHIETRKTHFQEGGLKIVLIYFVLRITKGEEEIF